MGDFPLMTENGTFIINGAERVVVSPARALARRLLHASKRTRPAAASCACAKLIPNRGAWLEFETSQPRRHVGQGRPQAQDPGHHPAARPAARRAGVHGRRARAPTRRSWRCSRTSTTSTRPPLHRSPRWTRTRPSNAEEALLEFYRRLRPGDPPNAGQRAHAAELAVLQLPPLRPGQGRPLQGQQAARARQTDIDRAHPHAPTTSIEIVREMIRLNNGKGDRGRHRPPGQPPRARRRRADPEPVPHRPAAHGARGQGAHVDHGPGDRPRRSR